MSFFSNIQSTVVNWFNHAPTQGVLWKFLSITSFTCVGFMACYLQKKASGLSAPQMAFFQMAFPFVILLCTHYYQKNLHIKQLLTDYPLFALLRSFLASLAFLSWFCVVRVLPFSAAILLKIATPLLTFLGAILFLKEEVSPNRFFGLGVLLISSFLFLHHAAWTCQAPFAPQTIEIFLLPLCLLLGASGAALMGKKLVPLVGVAPSTFSLLGLNTLWMLPVALYFWQPLHRLDYLWIIIMGGLEWLGQWSLAKALFLVDLSALAPLTLWRFALATFLGVIFLNEPFETAFLIGALLMATATPLVARRR